MKRSATKSLLASLISNLQLASLYRTLFPATRLLAALRSYCVRGYTDFPLSVNFLITARCNFNCSLCSAEPVRAQACAGSEVGQAALQDFLGAIACYRPVIHLGGGEPFVREDCAEIIAAVKRLGMGCMVTTNGFLLNKDTAEKIARAGLDTLIVSLYGRQEAHDRVTGVSRSFLRTGENLRCLLAVRSRKTKVLVSTVALPDTMEEIVPLLETVFALGIDAAKIEQLNFITEDEAGRKCAGGEFDLSVATHRVERPFEERFAVSLARIYAQVRRAYGNRVFIKPYLSTQQLHDWYTRQPMRYKRCSFIRHSLFVNANGDIIPCQFLPHAVMGNITRDSLVEVWRSPRYRRLRETIDRQRPAACLRCCKN